MVLHVHIHVPRAPAAYRGACPRMVATADRNAQEGKSDLDRGRTGFGEGDCTGLDYLGGPGMVVLFLGPGVRVGIHDQCWELYGHVPRRHDITNK